MPFLSPQSSSRTPYLSQSPLPPNLTLSGDASGLLELSSTPVPANLTLSGNSSAILDLSHRENAVTPAASNQVIAAVDLPVTTPLHPVLPALFAFSPSQMNKEMLQLSPSPTNSPSLVASAQLHEPASLLPLSPSPVNTPTVTIRDKDAQNAFFISPSPVNTPATHLAHKTLAAFNTPPAISNLLELSPSPSAIIPIAAAVSKQETFASPCNLLAPLITQVSAQSHLSTLHAAIDSEHSPANNSSLKTVATTQEHK
jgi:hypothetical protein